MMCNANNDNDLNLIFDEIYTEQKWYGGGSGEGSTIAFNQNTYIPFIRTYIDTHNITSVIDIGSGDCQCLHMLYHDKDITYNGYDCSKTIITETKAKYENEKFRFELIDGNEVLLYIEKKVDLLIIKDVLQHWTTSRIVSFLHELSAKVSFKKCLLVNDMSHSETTNIKDGQWRCINWKDSCFNNLRLKPVMIFGIRIPKEIVEFEGIKGG